MDLEEINQLCRLSRLLTLHTASLDNNRRLGDWEDHSGTGEHWVIGRITVVQEKVRLKEENEKETTIIKNATKTETKT